MNFDLYYTTRFRQDINQFFSTIPDKSRFHEDSQKRQYSIQYERLTRDFDHLNFLSKTEKEYLGIALFFTVLTDMVCYSHYRKYYPNFMELTRYPKFIGNCPGGCHYHLDPSDIFAAMNFSRKKPIDNLSVERLKFDEKFIEAIPTIEKEVKDFISKHLAEIDGQEFWDKCMAVFPYR